MVGVRVLIAVAFPTLATILYLWFRRKPAKDPPGGSSKPALPLAQDGGQSACKGDHSSSNETGEKQAESTSAVAPADSSAEKIPSSTTGTSDCTDTSGNTSVPASESNMACDEKYAVQEEKVRTPQQESPCELTACSVNNNEKGVDSATSGPVSPEPKASGDEASSRKTVKVLQRERSPYAGHDRACEREGNALKDNQQSKSKRTGGGGSRFEKRSGPLSPTSKNAVLPSSKTLQSKVRSRNCDTSMNCHDVEVSSLTGVSKVKSGGGMPVDSPVENGSTNGSDVHSEVSGDSGCGPSVGDVATPPVLECRDIVIRQFDFPTKLCGKLIGKNGRNVNVIKDKSDAEIAVKPKLHTHEYQLVQLKGTQEQVEIALNLIKQRFPSRKYRINYKDVSEETGGPILPMEIMQLNLPEGCTVDVMVSSVVTANHIFVQQPTHPTFPMLEKQNQCMMMCYAQDGIVPQLPRPIEVGVICAAPMFSGWYRAQIMQTYADSDECDIKFVDYGGYLRLASCLLRQIRTDFTSLPFQAVECYMANVVPPKDMETFPAEASALLEQMVQGKFVQAEIVSHAEDGIPCVQLLEYRPDGMTLFVNRELVNQGAASWLESQEECV